MNTTNYESLVLELTNKLSAIAPHAWEVMVRQSLLWGWSCLACWILVASLNATGLWYFFFKWKHEVKKDGYDDFLLDQPALYLGRIALVIMGAFMVIIGLSELPDVLTAIVNPEYRAMMSLIGKH